MANLVSIITPCYNGEKYLVKYFESILAQTYPAVELIFVNDGSTDKTEEIALAYGEKLKARGYNFIYIYQENAGQSAAINQGLRLFKGEYLNWTDADNYLPEDSIEKRVSYLESHLETGLVIGRTIVVEDMTFRPVSLIKEDSLDRTAPRELAEDFLKGQISCTCCCSTLVRSSMFRDSMPEPPQIEMPREIGQNCQLFLPIMFKYPTVYIPDKLGYYIIHQDSHSHAQKSFDQQMHIQDVGKETLYSIAARVKGDESDIEWFKSKIEEYDCKHRLDHLQHYRRKDGLREIIARMKSLGCYDAAARKMVLKIRYPVVKRIADQVWQRKNK